MVSTTQHATLISTQNKIKLPPEVTEKICYTEGKSEAHINVLKRYVTKVKSINRKIMLLIFLFGMFFIFAEYG